MFIDVSELPTIEAERVRLRWLAASDADALYAIFSDPEVMRYWSRPPMTGRHEAEQLLAEIGESFRSRALFQWGIALGGDDLVIGTCTLLHVDVPNKHAEIGYALNRSYWGRGYGHEALCALIDYAFETLGLHRLEADVDPRNLASVRALERLGFVREGYLRERWHVAGEVQDALFFGLLKQDWLAREQRAERHS
jgi:RimJ/RimL family protein N-acetyltransferase